MTWHGAERPARVTCAGCGRDRQPHSISDTGWICSTCAGKRRPTETCGSCGSDSAVIARNEHGQAICERCYVASRKTPCSSCGFVRRVITRTTSGGPLCRACAPVRPARVCGHCSQVGHHQVYDADGRPLCSRCWKRQEGPCKRCGQVRRVAVRLLAGPVCRSCLEAALADPTACARCGEVRPNAGSDGRVTAICPPCAGLRFRFQCPSCEKFTWPLVKGGTCATCRDHASAKRRVDRLTLDGPLIDYDRQVRAVLDTVPEPNQLVVRRYTRWAVTRPLRQQATTGTTIRTPTTRWALKKVKVAARFTTTASELGLALADITQTHLDSWLAEFPSHRPALRAFIYWCRAHGYLAAELEVRAASSRDLRRTLDDDARLELAQTLLRPLKGDDDPVARLAALLVLLFGQKTTDIAATPTTAVKITSPSRVELLLGATAIRLREPLAGLARNIATAATDLGSPWLFPSRQTGSHLSAERLSERMRTLGLPSLVLARNAARAALAERVPAPLLADRLGLSISAASQWAKAMGAARGTYAGLRTGGQL